jgi:hypothetical protein
MLLDRLPEWAEPLARDLHEDRRRSCALRRALAARTAGDRHAALWPRLGLVSCWTDANAAGPAAHLTALFPHARVQGKGLIATEGFVSFPLVGRNGCALAIRSHFLEFEPVDSEGQAMAGDPRLAHELDRGQRYGVILSTGGGLYRYRLHDVIEVVDRLRECPLVRFVGRQDAVSDWVGEKLNEAFVAATVRTASALVRVAPRFAMLACDDSLSPPSYVLYVDADEPDEALLLLADRIEIGLRRSVHYDYARGLRQLGPLRIFRAGKAADTYLLAAIRAGNRAGSVKPPALDRRSGWSLVFSGELIDRTSSHVGGPDVRPAEEPCVQA